MPAEQEPKVPLTRATEDLADAELEAEFKRLNPEIQRRVAYRALELDGCKREIERLEAELQAAQEREQALRREVEGIRLQMSGPLRRRLWEALAAQRTEEPSE